MSIRRLKRSEAILAAIGIALMTLIIGYAFFIKENVRPLDLDCSPELLLASGDVTLDTVAMIYNHLIVELKDVELINDQEHLVTLEIYENAKDHYKMELKGDTLYVGKKNICAPNVVTDETINGVKIKVGARSLQTITVGRDGSIEHPLRPYGSYDTGKPAYKPEDLEKHTYSFDTLTINFIENGYVDLLLDGKTLILNNIRVKPTRGIRTNLIKRFYGMVDELIVNEVSGTVQIMAKYLDSKKVWINPDRTKPALSKGIIDVSTSDTLAAYLYNDMDVRYIGQPVILKEEKDYGRVINLNYTLP